MQRKYISFTPKRFTQRFDTFFSFRFPAVIYQHLIALQPPFEQIIILTQSCRKVSPRPLSKVTQSNQTSPRTVRNLLHFRKVMLLLTDVSSFERNFSFLVALFEVHAPTSLTSGSGFPAPPLPSNTHPLTHMKRNGLNFRGSYASECSNWSLLRLRALKSEKVYHTEIQKRFIRLRINLHRQSI